MPQFYDYKFFENKTCPLCNDKLLLSLNNCYLHLYNYKCLSNLIDVSNDTLKINMKLYDDYDDHYYYHDSTYNATLEKKIMKNFIIYYNFKTYEMTIIENKSDEDINERYKKALDDSNQKYSVINYKNDYLKHCQLTINLNNKCKCGFQSCNDLLFINNNLTNIIWYDFYIKNVRHFVYYDKTHIFGNVSMNTCKVSYSLNNNIFFTKTFDKFKSFDEVIEIGNKQLKLFNLS